MQTVSSCHLLEGAVAEDLVRGPQRLTAVGAAGAGVPRAVGEVEGLAARAAERAAVHLQPHLYLIEHSRVSSAGVALSGAMHLGCLPFAALAATPAEQVFAGPLRSPAYNPWNKTRQKNGTRTVGEVELVEIKGRGGRIHGAEVLFLESAHSSVWKMRGGGGGGSKSGREYLALAQVTAGGISVGVADVLGLRLEGKPHGQGDCGVPLKS